MWMATPIPNPTAVHIPIVEEYWIEFLQARKKSGPGLISANKWTRVTVTINMRSSNNSNQFFLVKSIIHAPYQSYDNPK